ncbi:hypothetical protein EPA93_02925 [Ktedonosporobacter rubrisoli]|uniref:Uncharacterized protein n=1 Tax=Ktedonosporobacter rubrisoli TaxID=2509675 RepID=A0A4V0YY51_KTERU|nr:hypothetical protein [Ktedonosporobacter rubrisoli]QBD75001.1 hypothetical protein EPA93_02925 [Ktedonosporobacter rubrisoli]
MEPEDFLEPEVVITAAVTAAICSPRVRKVARRGLVYGISGVLLVGDALASFARNVGQGVKQAETVVANVSNQAQEVAVGVAASGASQKRNQKGTTDKGVAEGK